jgi:hypothetical protein
LTLEVGLARFNLYDVFIYQRLKFYTVPRELEDTTGLSPYHGRENGCGVYREDEIMLSDIGCERVVVRHGESVVE